MVSTPPFIHCGRSFVFRHLRSSVTVKRQALLKRLLTFWFLPALKQHWFFSLCTQKANLLTYLWWTLGLIVQWCFICNICNCAVKLFLDFYTCGHHHRWGRLWQDFGPPVCSVYWSGKPQAAAGTPSVVFEGSACESMSLSLPGRAFVSWACLLLPTLRVPEALPQFTLLLALAHCIWRLQWLPPYRLTGLRGTSLLSSLLLLDLLFWMLLRIVYQISWIEMLTILCGTTITAQHLGFPLNTEPIGQSELGIVGLHSEVVVATKHWTIQ